MRTRFLRSTLLNSFFHNIRPIQPLFITHSFSRRFCSDSYDATAVLKEFLSKQEQKVPIEDYSHPSLELFDQVSTDSLNKGCWIRKYGNDETIQISIKVGDVSYSSSDEDDEITHTGERRVHFQINLSRSEEVEIEVNAYGSQKYRDFSLTDIIIHNKDGISYKKNFFEFDAHVQDAFYGFIQERIGVTIAQAMQEYYDLLQKKVHQRWRSDLKEYIDG